MSVSEIQFVSREAAESVLFYPETAIISITDPGRRVASLAAQFSKVLRLSFYDAIPGDEFIPIPLPGCFDQKMAREIIDFVQDLHLAPSPFKVVVHCEQGISRSAAVALYVEAYTQTPLVGRERAHRANTWVTEQLEQLSAGIVIDIPLRPAGAIDESDDS